MKKLLIIVMLSVFMVAGFAACSGNSGAALSNGKWFLRSYGEQDHLLTLIDGSEITATFDSGEALVSGSAGCNTYFADYETIDDRLLISEMAFTEKACLSPEGLMEQEQDYLHILSKARTFQVDDTTLTIFSSGRDELHFTMDDRTR